MSVGLPRAVESWLRLLLRLHTRGFRERHGAEMLQFAADAWSDRGRGGGMWAKIAVTARLSTDAIRSGLRSRFPRWRGPGGEGREPAAARDARLLSPAVGGWKGGPATHDQDSGSFGGRDRKSVV